MKDLTGAITMGLSPELYAKRILAEAYRTSTHERVIRKSARPFCNQERVVCVKAVSEDGIVQEEFESRNANNLTKILDSLKVPAEETGCALRFSAYVEVSLPFGIHRTKHIVGSVTRGDALQFLAK
jgi:hypothetical protein